MFLTKIGVHLRNRKVLVVAEVAADTELRLYEFAKPIHDALRFEANRDIGIGIHSGTFKAPFYRCRANIKINQYSLNVSWKAHPLWWSDHPRWYDGPSCFNLEPWPQIRQFEFIDDGGPLCI